MRTDAMESFFGGNGKAAARMDCTGFQKRNSTGMESAARQDQVAGKRPFKKALAEVTAENVAAYRSTKATVAKRESGSVKTSRETDRRNSLNEENRETRQIPEELLQFLLSTVSESKDGVPVAETMLISDDVADSAEAMVGEALTVLSEALGISIFGNLNEFSLKEVGKDTQGQFAEIVFTLRKMLQAFEASGEQGMPIELPTGTVEGEGIDALADVLRVSVFKIEVACSMLGIAEPVQRQVAMQMEAFQAGGIIQATDPSTIMMASQHTEKLFKGMFSGDETSSELTALVQQVKKLLAEHGEDTSGIMVEMAAGGKPAPFKGDLQQFDATVYRAMLKIDKEVKVEQENGQAVIAGDKEGSVKLAQPAIPVAQDPDTNVVPAVQPGVQFGTGIGSETRISSTLMRMTDETVMEQISGKLQTAVRSGMSEVRIQLRPESLGEVSMRIRMEGDVVLAKIEVQNQQVKEIMERNLPMLKDALAQQNLNTGAFEIQVNSGNGRHFGNMPHSPWNQEETAGNGVSGQGGDDEEHGYTGEQGRRPGSDTGRRFGSNSVEYFA